MNIFPLIASILFAAEPTYWPAFLGMGATKVDPATIPLRWSHAENIAWKARLPGKGQSSPVIWKDRVFATSIEGSMKEHCHSVALELSNGQSLWQRTIPAAQMVRSNYFQSRSAPTPVVDAERLYAFFETGNVIALSHDGEIKWQRSLTKDYGAFESDIGLASSPLIVDDQLVLLIDHEGPSYLIALDRTTGATRWKTDRDSRKSYSSPALISIGAKPQIICSSTGSVDGYDPATGERLWSYDEVGGNTSATPLPIGDGRFLIAASPGMHNEREQEARKSNICMRIDGTTGGFLPTIEWKAEQAMPSFASPIVYRDHAYWVNKVGAVFCFDSRTGAKRYVERTKQVAWCTPVGIGDRLYVFGKDGLTTVLATGPEFRILAENELWDSSSVPADVTARDRSHGGHNGHQGESEKKSTRYESAQTTEARTSDPSSSTPAGNPLAKAVASSPVEGGRRPPMSEKERDEARARGENRFADPVQYGVAVVNGSLVIRTGEIVYCVRNLQEPN